jgi:hypothetical protein
MNGFKSQIMFKIQLTQIVAIFEANTLAIVGNGNLCCFGKEGPPDLSARLSDSVPYLVAQVN